MLLQKTKKKAHDHRGCRDGHGEGSCGGAARLPDCQAIADLASSPSRLRPAPNLDPAGARDGGGEQEEH